MRRRQCLGCPSDRTIPQNADPADMRLCRYSLVVEDNIVKAVNIEEVRPLHRRLASPEVAQ